MLQTWSGAAVAVAPAGAAGEPALQCALAAVPPFRSAISAENAFATSTVAAGWPSPLWSVR